MWTLGSEPSSAVASGEQFDGHWGGLVSGIGWLITLTSCLFGLAFCRAAHLESVGRKRALVEQTLEYERTRRETGS